MRYDKIIKKHIDGEEIEYGIILGNEKIVFMKTGADGNINGYQNKYLKMAHRIHEKTGATVLCSSNPYIENGHDIADQSTIAKVALEEGHAEYTVDLVGVSDGAYHNFTLAKNMPQVVKMLCINASFISCKDLIEKVKKLSSIQKILVYGTKDQEYDSVHRLEASHMDALKIIAVDGADHQFTGMLDQFIALMDFIE